MEIFIKDLVAGTYRRLTAPGGVTANMDSYVPMITADGSKAAFTSYATNLLGGTTYRSPALFGVDLTSGHLSLLSATASGVSEDGGAGTPSLAPDGSAIVWATNATNLANVPAGSTNLFKRSFVDGSVGLLSTNSSGAPSDGLTTHPVLSHSGRYLAFQSSAPAFGGNGATTQVYVKDLANGAVTLVSSDASGAPGTASSSHPQWSPDDSRLLMETTAPNLVPGIPSGATEIVVKTLQSGMLTLLSVNPSNLPGNGNSNHPQWSPSGKMVVFASTAPDLVPGDTNRKADIFVANAP